MIKNGRYYVAPQHAEGNFKQVFARLVAAGAGRPVDLNGFPDGPWTPEKLADAITAIEGNQTGIELRAVQVWFQNNDNGISNDNIRWLARIFGCHDPEETGKWQTELMVSKDRLTIERRAKQRKSEKSSGSTQSQPAIDYDISLENTFLRSHTFSGMPLSPDTKPAIRGMSLAWRCEQLFSGPNHLIMPILIWGGLGILWFLAIILGVHSITYSPVGGIDKQVGFIWSPGWNLGEPIFLPILLILCRYLINSWKGSDRGRLLEYGRITVGQDWYEKVRSFTSSFWAIFLICFVLIFVVQWAGVYLMPLIANEPDVAMIDWMLVALVRPDVLSTDAAISVSFLGFLYSGMIYWFLFSASLFLFIISGDYAEICKGKDDSDIPLYNGDAINTGLKIMQSVFRCTVLGIMVALCIKLNAAYLVSDAESITGWLWEDALILLGYSTDRWLWINGSPSPFFTSFLLLFLLCFVFVACLLEVKSGVDRTDLFAQDQNLAMRPWFWMCAIIGILSVGYITIGQFYGFSVLLGVSVAIALMSLFWRFEPQNSESDGKRRT